MVLVQSVPLLHLEDQFVSASLDGRGIRLGNANPNELTRFSSMKYHHELQYNEVALRGLAILQNHIYTISKNMTYSFMFLAFFTLNRLFEVKHLALNRNVT